MDASAELHDALHAAGLAAVAPYAVSMAYRVRFYMDMNAREAMHLIELRTAPQGHPAVSPHLPGDAPLDRRRRRPPRIAARCSSRITQKSSWSVEGGTRGGEEAPGWNLALADS